MRTSVTGPPRPGAKYLATAADPVPPPPRLGRVTDAHISDRTAKARRMEEVIRGYFDACNSGDGDAVAKYFAPGAVHYFPPDMYEGPFRGGETAAAGPRLLKAGGRADSRSVRFQNLC